MIEIVIWFVLGFGLLRLGVASFNLFSKPVLQKSATKIEVQLSILIPARNEEANLPTLLNSLREQKDAWLEVLVLDDHSTDRTSEIVDDFSKKNNAIRLIKGHELPDGWLGKNFACHQLGLEAKGDYFLFLDADVLIHDGAITAALSQIVKSKSNLLSLFPDQLMVSLGEKIVVPTMHYFLLSLLPLRAVRYFKKTSMSAANGQFMLFEANTYRLNQFHELVKSKVVEDVEIMRVIKQMGFNGEVLLGNDLVQARMYHSLKESIDGFSKNLFEGFGRSWFAMSSYFFISIFAWALIFVFGSSFQIILSLFIILLIRVCVSLISNQSFIRNLLLHPLQMLMFVYIGFRSGILITSGKIAWKGRSLTHIKN